MNLERKRIKNLCIESFSKYMYSNLVESLDYFIDCVEGMNYSDEEIQNRFMKFHATSIIKQRSSKMPEMISKSHIISSITVLFFSTVIIFGICIFVKGCIIESKKIELQIVKEKAKIEEIKNK